MGGNVLKSYVKTLAFAAGLSWATAAGAVGFGDATVNSALGQPLKVEITLTSVGSADRTGMTARLASPDAFKAAGLEYPYHLSRLKFNIVNRGGQTFILVTSSEPINDSFINLLVELNWPSGRMQREYTLLLDPPDYKPEPVKPEPVAPIEPVVPTPPEETPPEVAPAPPVTASAPQAAPVEVPVAAAEPEVAAPASAPEVATAPAPASGVQEVEATPAAAVPQAQPVTQQPTGEAQTAAAVPQPQVRAKARERETVTVKHGDTLSKIAAQVKEPDVTLEQMVVAIYRANARKFEGRNMNRIRAGKILTIPEPEEYEHLSQAAAAKEIRIQTANWQAYRQKLAAAPTAATETPKQAAGGKISTTVAEQAPPKQPPGKLVLSQGAAPGEKAAAGGKTAAKDEATAKAGEAKDTEQRIAQQEKINKDLKTAIEVKGGPASGAAPTPPAAASGTHPGSGVAQTKPKLPTPAAPAPEPSILDDILDNPMVKQVTELDPIYLGGGAAALLVVVGGIIVVIRRRGSGGRAPKKKR